MEEVKIVVSQESRGSALTDNATKIEQLKAKVAELNALERSYTDKGMPTAAASVRGERTPYVRELRAMQVEQRGIEKAAAAASAAEAKERLAVERAITVQKAEQAAIAKAQRAALNRNESGFSMGLQRGAGQVGANLPGLGGLGGIGGVGGVLGMVVGSIVGVVTRLFHDDLEASKASARIAASGIEASNTTMQIGGIGGVRGEGMATGNFHSLRAHLAAAEAKRGTFGGQDGGWWDQIKHGTNSLFGSKFRTDSSNADEENAQDIKQTKNELFLAQKQAQQKYRDGVGGLELAQSRALAEGHMQEARAIGYKILRAKEYDELLEKSGSEKFANEGADLAVAEKKRQAAGQLAQLVTARSGAGDTARIASAAHDLRTESSGIAKLNADMNRNHRQAADDAFRVNFSRLKL